MRTLIVLAARYVYAFACCVYLFTLGWLRGRDRALMAAICSHFGLATPVIEPALPEVAIEDLLGSDVFVRIPAPTAGDGNVSPLETIVIARLAAALAPRRCFEIGTFDGRTTLTLAANCSADARVFSLDLPAEELDRTLRKLERADRAYVDKPIVGARLQGRPEAERVVQLLGDSAAFDFAPYRGNIDLVFVDGSHAYDYVLSDSRHALQMLCPGRGVILWHDYGGWPGVTRALDHLHAKDPDFQGLRRIAGTSLACLTCGDLRSMLAGGTEPAEQPTGTVR